MDATQAVSDESRVDPGFISSLIVGLRVNVRSPASIREGAEPMEREVLSTNLNFERGLFRWVWRVEGPTPEGRIDCGYSCVEI